MSGYRSASWPDRQPRGIAFTIEEHLVIRRWAASCDLQVVTELDRVICGEEYEEVLAFYHPNSCWRRLTLWRHADAVVLEPSIGASRHFPTVNQATQAACGLVTATSRRAAVTRAALRAKAMQKPPQSSSSRDGLRGA
jgi:hypothetical protein